MKTLSRAEQLAKMPDITCADLEERKAVTNLLLSNGYRKMVAHTDANGMIVKVGARKTYFYSSLVGKTDILYPQITGSDFIKSVALFI